MLGPRRVFTFALAGSSALVLLIAARAVVGARSELDAGDAARRHGDDDSARWHYRRAARWYAPANPYCVEALDRLSEMAAEAEDRGDDQTALASWRAIRAAILATRGAYTPHARRLEVATERIAALMAERPPPIDAGKSERARQAELRAQLDAVPRPEPIGAVAALLGFACWVLAAFLLALRAVDSCDRIVRREALRWGGLGAFGLLLFAAGLGVA